jgi:hypothetical protein
VHGPPLDAQGAVPELLWPLWNYQTGAGVLAVALTPDASRVAAGSEDGHVYLLVEPSLWHVRAEPGPALLFLDGREHGRTPLTLRLPPGPHHLRFRREGYLEEELTLQTRPGLSATLEVRLRPDPARQRPA